MKYLIDTDWVIDYLNDRPAAVSLLRSLADEGMAISLATFGEIYHGIYRGRDPHAAEETFGAFRRWVDVIPLDEAIMRRFARIRGELYDYGRKIGNFDILIAATALERDLTLVTRNRSHFERISDLKLLPENG